MATPKKDSELKRQKGSEKLHGDPLEHTRDREAEAETSVEDRQDAIANPAKPDRKGRN